MKANYNLWIENKEAVVLSQWRAALLRAAEQGGTLAHAARAMGVSAGTARKKLREMETALGAKLLEPDAAAAGGKGVRLTRRARKLLDQFDSFSAGLDEEIARRYRASFGK
jgi:molybdate transport repressor ModE-like protein